MGILLKRGFLKRLSYYIKKKHLYLTVIIWAGWASLSSNQFGSNNKLIYFEFGSLWISDPVGCRYIRVWSIHIRVIRFRINLSSDHFMFELIQVLDQIWVQVHSNSDEREIWILIGFGSLTFLWPNEGQNLGSNFADEFFDRVNFFQLYLYLMNHILKYGECN